MPFVSCRAHGATPIRYDTSLEHEVLRASIGTKTPGTRGNFPALFEVLPAAASKRARGYLQYSGLKEKSSLCIDLSASDGYILTYNCGIPNCCIISVLGVSNSWCGGWID